MVLKGALPSPAMQGRWGSVGGSAVAVIAFVLFALPHGASAGSAGILAPDAGAKVKSAPTEVTVRAPWKLRSLRVWLNGRSLSREFEHAEISLDGRRTVEVSAGHGLRYGKNVLRVKKKPLARARRPGGPASPSPAGSRWSARAATAPSTSAGRFA